MFLRGRMNQKGVSLLELLVSIMIFTTALMAFAMVFPSGYRLNYKTRMESRAAKIAEGLVQKIMNVQFLGDTQAKPTIQNLQSWDTQGTYRFKTEFEDLVPAPFYLPPRSDPNCGINVRILDPTVDSGTLAKIEVNVCWLESTRAREITKKVTITSYRSRNH